MNENRVSDSIEHTTTILSTSILNLSRGHPKPNPLTALNFYRHYSIAMGCGLSRTSKAEKTEQVTTNDPEERLPQSDIDEASKKWAQLSKTADRPPYNTGSTGWGSSMAGVP